MAPKTGTRAVDTPSDTRPVETPEQVAAKAAKTAKAETASQDLPKEPDYVLFVTSEAVNEPFDLWLGPGEKVPGGFVSGGGYVYFKVKNDLVPRAMRHLLVRQQRVVPVDRSQVEKLMPEPTE